MRANGMKSLGLPMLMMQGATDGPFIDWQGGQLTVQDAKNLQAFIGWAKSIGFDYFLVAPQFYAEHDLRQSAFEANKETLYGDNFRLFLQLKSILDGEGVEAIYDLCTEGVGDTRGSCVWYSQRIWTDWTCSFWPDGLPCWDATISIVPTQPNVSAMPGIFRGLDPGGPVNWPGLFNFHSYAQNGRLYPGSPLNGPRLWLQQINAPVRSWVLGETDTLTDTGDMQIAQDANRFVADTKQLIERVFQWPVTPRDPEGASCTVFPTMWMWGEAGF